MTISKGLRALALVVATLVTISAVALAVKVHRNADWEAELLNLVPFPFFVMFTGLSLSQLLTSMALGVFSRRPR